MSKIIVTIGRQYGSGGKEIGEKLAADLGIPFYDKELLNEAAKKSGMCEEIFETHDEKPVNSFLYSVVLGNYASGNMPINHKLFLAQFETIKDLAAKGSCVILGRCADYALENDKDTVDVFIYGDIKSRVERGIKNYGLDTQKAEETILKTDKQRAAYYNFYSGKKWGDMSNYDICINSSLTGVEGAVEIIKKLIGIKQNQD